MTRAKKNALRLLAVFLASQALVLYAQTTPPTQTPPPAPAIAAPDKPPLTKQELEQLLAPLALYPDDLLTQVLMASTYPLEIVQADRWLKKQTDTKSDAFAKALEAQPWDASVKSIVNFPDVLSLMSDKLDLTIKLGDAFIAQQADVLNTVQVLRNKAQAAGNLKSSDKVKVTVEAAAATAPADPQVVVVQSAPPQVVTIESANPSVVYVPTYNPTVVYGSWPYPSYPPYPYYPPYPAGYVATAAVSFGLGVAAGAAWGYAWGNSNWGHGDVDIDVNRNNNFNRNIDRSKYQGGDRTNNIGNGNRAGGAGGAGGARAGGAGAGAGRSTWQHNPAHRDGVPYSNQRAADKAGGASNRQATQARDAYRGRADTGRQNLQSGQAGNLGQNRPNSGQLGGAGQNRPNTGQVGAGQNRPNTGQVGAGQNRPAGGQGAAPPAQQPANRSGASGGAFGGVNSSGSANRAASQRGATSRSTPAARPSGGAARSSGGGARAGGGRSGGGRR